jgi:KDO2-lipid IV(A) lauroyltransferase
MNFLIYWFGRMGVALIQFLPLRWVAHLGRAFGAIAWTLDGKHRRIALDNLTQCFSAEKSAAEIEAIARENFLRIGENYLTAIKTATMSLDDLGPHIEYVGREHFPGAPPGQKPQNIIVAIGHFGNFELFARVNEILPQYIQATTYRALKQPGLNRVMEELRANNKCHFFERRSGGPELRELLDGGGVLLGLMADQSSEGMRAPFLGRDCNTGLAPAVLALRYNAKLYTAICHRVGLAQWRLEFIAEVATRINGKRRPSADLMLDVNHELEKAVRQDPANWFWVHRRWKK